jgi:CheY-like chemotaxis protein
VSKHIMVLNDAKEVLLLLEAVLKDAGYNVSLETFAASEPEYKRIAAMMPDLVILDCSVKSELKGWEIIEQLKLVSETALLPIIICTTYEHKMDNIETYLSTKRITVLRKPFDIADLLAAVEQALKHNDIGSDAPVRV